MKPKRKNLKRLLVLAISGVVVFWGCLGGEAQGVQGLETAKEYRIITDMRGKDVKIPKEIKRVVTVCDGLVIGVMTHLGEEHKIVGVGSSCVQRNFKYTFPAVSGEHYAYEDGMNPVTYLNPWIMELPLIASSGEAMNYETLASLEPDLIILRLGSCTLGWTEDDEHVKKTIGILESLGIPFVVLHGTSYSRDPDVDKISEEIRIIGQVFDKEDQAMELAVYLESIVDMVKERTKDIPESAKPDVLMFGLSPETRNAGGAGNVRGVDTIESRFIEKIVNARNAYQGAGSRVVFSTEHVLALNPDVIVLPTSWGYHPPSELYTAPYYRDLQELDAVKNRRVYALAWTPCNCAKRVEYPIEVMIIAKAAYPERFKDIKIHAWVLEFYQKVYGVDPETAKRLRSAQWLDWTVEDDI